MPAPITAQEIKDIRTGYGLSQRSFALLLGIGPASIVRYEQGATPSKANANLIRAARNPQFMAECLEADGDIIPKAQCLHAQKVVYDYISLDPQKNGRLHEGLDISGLPSTMSMSEMYHFTLQQEILNEQAANLIGEIISLRVSMGLKGNDEGTFSVLLRELALMKPTIVSKDTLDDRKLSEIRGFLNSAASMIATQRAEVA